MTQSIELTKGYYAIVDDEDYGPLSRWKWTADERPDGQVYARRVEAGTKIYMHRFILGAPAHLDVDHRDQVGLNNTRSNLRTATRSQNNANGRNRMGRTSRYRGVSFDRTRSKWMMQIKLQGESTRRRFDSETEAARAYDDIARTLFGEFASLNFPAETP